MNFHRYKKGTHCKAKPALLSCDLYVTNNLQIKILSLIKIIIFCETFQLSCEVFLYYARFAGCCNHFNLRNNCADLKKENDLPGFRDNYGHLASQCRFGSELCSSFELFELYSHCGGNDNFEL